MPTSSIFTNVVIEGDESAEWFFDALEAAMRDKEARDKGGGPEKSAGAYSLAGVEELRKLFANPKTDRRYTMEENKNDVDNIQQEEERNISFDLSPAESKAVREWAISHLKEAHGVENDEQWMEFCGCIAGAFTFEFIPTSLGVLGQIKCGACGQTHVFWEIL